MQIKLGNVLIRSDLNVPINNKKVSDNFRILKAVSYLDELKKISKNIIFCSHLGRPKGIDSTFSLEPVAIELSNIINEKVEFINDCLHENISDTINNSSGKVYLLENLRFYSGEEENELEFSKKLSKPYDSFIFDAFGSAHREHASVVSVGKYLDSYQGKLVSKEVSELQPLIEGPDKPFSIILGGAKVSDKLQMIENLLPNVDNLLLGGGMCFTFLKALGFNIGKSLFEESYVPIAKKILDSTEGSKILLPTDFGVTTDINSSERFEKQINDFGDDDMGIDIGKESVKSFIKHLEDSKTIFWNGPMGVFENSAFAYGTKEITSFLSQTTANTVVGGGDSVSAINTFSKLEMFNHISTGGGASIEFLEGIDLPGVNKYNSLII